MELLTRDNYQPPADPKLGDPWVLLETDGAILRNRRIALGMTQQEVADAAHIQLRQYQRFEADERDISSSSMRIGLSVCRVLKIDPYMFFPFI